MKVLILGASGATGRLVASELMKRMMSVRIVVREHAVLPQSSKENPLMEVVTGDVDTFTQQKVQELLDDCGAAVCCLGHRTTIRGIFGKPHRLVIHAVQKVTTAMEALSCSQKLILMSTTAYTNKQDGEKDRFGEALVLSLLKVLLPPHRDNMLAADFLVHRIGTRGAFSWVAVRPDTLIDAENPSEYKFFSHTNRSPVFNAGKTSRINVAACMAELLTDEQLWEQWKYKTPVLYNKLG
ncbi:MAG: NAD(P)-binding oxidoreductase [Sphaerochaeta sp.]